MRQINSTTWECTACGEHVEIPRGTRRPIAMLLTIAGRRRERVVTVGDDVVHRCILGEDHSETDTQGSG